MCSTDRRLAAGFAAALALGGCAEEAGLNGAWSRAPSAVSMAMALQAGDAGAGAAQAAFVAAAPTVVNFDFGSAALDAEARSALAAQAAWLAARPDLAVAVVGHTDAVGAEAANDRLGRARADAVARYLTGAGVAPDRFAAIASRGEREPVVVSDGPSRANRRAVTAVGAAPGAAGAARPVGEMDGVRAARVIDAYQTTDTRFRRTSTARGGQ
jgi:outer membrane protein OmpA-like peptidoglycan-associated protein